MRILIVGGTGTLGKALIPKIKGEGVHIYNLSREEIKQKILKKQFPHVQNFLGDVKSKSDLKRVFEHVRPDTVFHLAALKHVEIAEENPEECIAVNLLGTQNLLDLCQEYSVENFIFSSTDKAVLPINIYGQCKAASEKLIECAALRESTITNMHIFRWGNVLGSRGSVIHAFAESLKNEGKAYITDLVMTRFWIHIDDAAAFMAKNFKHKEPMVHIPPMKASRVVEVAWAVAQYLNIDDFEIVETGIRRGEKIHETLVSEHSKHGGCLRSDTCEQYSREELLDMVERVFKND